MRSQVAQARQTASRVWRSAGSVAGGQGTGSWTCPLAGTDQGTAGPEHTLYAQLQQVNSSLKLHSG